MKKHTVSPRSLRLIHNRRGRSDGPPGLVDALILRADAQSRRTASRITALLATHISAGDVARWWIAECARIHALVAGIPERWLAECRAAGLPEPSPAALATVRREIADALAPFVVTPNERARAAESDTLPPPPTVTRSRTLAAARAQNAALAARLIDLRGRLVKPGTLALGGRAR